MQYLKAIAKIRMESLLHYIGTDSIFEYDANENVKMILSLKFQKLVLAELHQRGERNLKFGHLTCTNSSKLAG